MSRVVKCHFCVWQTTDESWESVTAFERLRRHARIMHPVEFRLVVQWLKDTEPNPRDM